MICQKCQGLTIRVRLVDIEQGTACFAQQCINCAAVVYEKGPMIDLIGQRKPRPIRPHKHGRPWGNEEGEFSEIPYIDVKGLIGGKP